MASILVLKGARAGRSLKQSKKDTFKEDFKSELVLNDSSHTAVQAGDVIDGVVRVQNTRALEHWGIRVQFEASIIVKYETKVDGRVTSKQLIDDLVAGSVDAKNAQYFHSPVGVQISGSETDKGNTNLLLSKNVHSFKLLPGSHSFPFQLVLTEESLPAPFANQFGSLKYKVVGYIRHSSCYVNLGEETLKFKGYLNISSLPEIPRPLKDEFRVPQSTVTIVFHVMNPERSFLPGEEIVFQLTIKNSESQQVGSFSVRLIREARYSISNAGNSKKLETIVGTFTSAEVSNETSNVWNGRIAIPEKCIPTYTLKSVYNVTYYLQYTFNVENIPKPLERKVTTIIGTARSSES